MGFRLLRLGVEGFGSGWKLFPCQGGFQGLQVRARDLGADFGGDWWILNPKP